MVDEENLNQIGPPIGPDVEVRSEELLAPSAIKNQRGASKAPSRGLWMPELILYGIREQSRALDQ